MNVFDAQHDLVALRARLKSGGTVVACYCAAWCDTCTRYRTDFAALAARWPQCIFIWVDIEECEHLLAEEEIEDFPTLLVQGDQSNFFYGPLPPQIGHLERLISAANEDRPLIGGGPPSWCALLESAA
jgi:thioredoxin 1